MDHNPLIKDADIARPASQIIPGTMFSHMSVQHMMPDGYPRFFDGAEGWRLGHVDNNKYMDLIGAYGPLILRYQHPEVEAVADAQHKKLNTATGSASAVVGLAGRVVDMVSCAGWRIFAKNRTNATMQRMTIAQAPTDRRKILAPASAYHAAAPRWMKTKRFPPLSLPTRPGLYL